MWQLTSDLHAQVAFLITFPHLENASVSGLIPHFCAKTIHSLGDDHAPGAGIKGEEWRVAVLTELTAWGGHSTHTRTIPTQWSKNKVGP